MILFAKLFCATFKYRVVAEMHAAYKYPFFYSYLEKKLIEFLRLRIQPNGEASNLIFLHLRRQVAILSSLD